jgi:hypothetical protein
MFLERIKNYYKAKLAYLFKRSFGNYLLTDQFLWRPIESLLLYHWLNNSALEELGKLINWLLKREKFRYENRGDKLISAYYTHARESALENLERSKKENDINLLLCDY